MYSTGKGKKCEFKSNSEQNISEGCLPELLNIYVSVMAFILIDLLSWIKIRSLDTTLSHSFTSLLLTAQVVTPPFDYV